MIYSYILSNLPAFIVALPLLVAPILAMMSGRAQYLRTIMWQITYITVLIILLAAIYLFVAVYKGGSLSYLIGGWSIPMGIEYEVTPLSSMLLVLISALVLAILPFGKKSVEAEISHKKAGLFWCTFLLLLSGLLGMVVTNDIFNIYVFLEISSLASYALVALGPDKRALTAAFNYLAVGGVGGMLFLTGIAFLYAKTGSLNISDISYQLGVLKHSKLEVAALVFMFIGLGIKAGIVPLAGWLPRAYQFAPSFVAIFLSAVSTKVSLYLIAKVLFVLFGKAFALDVLGLGNLLLVLGCVAIVFGGMAAIYQTNYKRLLAFSCLSNIGLIVLGIGLASGAGLSAAILHFISHSIAIAGLFIIVSTGSTKGLGKTKPFYAALLVLFALSTVGMPLTIGFLSKWQLLVAGIEGGWVAAFAVVAASGLSILYMLKLVHAAYYQKPDGDFVTSHYVTTSLVTLAAVVALFGLFPAALFEFALQTAKGFAK